MSRAELPSKLQRFIAAHVESVEKLEVLLLLYNSADKWWSAQSVYQKIQSNPQSVARRLANLKAEGFLLENKDGCFQFHPKTPELADGVALLNTEYEQRRVKVIEAIFSHSTEQMRRFADAFRRERNLMIPKIVYLLCGLTSAGCAILLLRSYALNRSRLLFWSGLCFVLFGISNIGLFIDLVLLPNVDLSIYRNIITLAALVMLVYGLIWEAS